ncbi:MAG TPA: rhodanese-like domain-containing protein [Thermoanaerobaculia bacterium]
MKNEECGTRNDERRPTGIPRFIVQRSSFIVVLVLALASCKTVGVSMTAGGYAEVSPQVANEMILDSRQVVLLDVRGNDAFRGPEGYIAGALSVPFESIERQLPELLPYQNQTVLVYGDGDADGAVAAKLLTVAGFRNVVHIAGGLKGWIEHGYRTVNAQ